MTPRYVEPSIKAKSFSCPHCGALADQKWFKILVGPILNAGLPKLMTKEFVDGVEKDERNKGADSHYSFAGFQSMIERWRKEARGAPMLTERGQNDVYGSDMLENMHVSQCYSCKELTIWKYDNILHPPKLYEIEANPDLNAAIRADFDEARTVLDLSPRASAALLRLCIQKTCEQLGVNSKNLNTAIGKLVQDGLPKKIQKALDIVRVLGNHAVHPGELNLKDDRDTAIKLFELVNLIAYTMISQPKEVDALFEERVPEGVKQAITTRDSKVK